MTRFSYPKYQNQLSFRNKIARLLWATCYIFLFRPFSLPIFHKWRILILRTFGAKIGAGSIIHASVKIWAPWNLQVGQRTAIGPEAICYNPGKIILGSKTCISQRAHLCTASHDYTKSNNPLITDSIIIKDYAWVATESFISMGITIGDGAVIGARAVVIKDVEPWTVVAGNPAKFIKKREINSD